MFDMSKRTARRFAQVLHGAVTLLSSASIVVSSVSASFAQSIIVDPSAPGTSFLQSSNGTTQVDIATPVQGVSLNQFSDFNVGADGLILNNSATGGVSVIGQNVTANPNLMVSGPASTIVGEVTGPAPSSLTGTTEVFGQSAAVVIANPNGISCNGCAFLNSTSSTLTTGAPIIDGAEVDLLVTQGTVTIGPDGFQPGQQGGLFGRHVTVNGAVSTDEQKVKNSLVVSGGAQRVQGLDFERLSRTEVVAAPSTVARTSPFAVDASEDGQLTGGGIRVYGMEVGQGVNIYGDVDGRGVGAESKGDLFYKTVDAEYWASFSGRDVRQYGDLTATQDVTINADSFTLYDGRKITTGIPGGESLINQNGVLKGQVRITADDFVVIAGEVSAEEIHIDVTTGSLTNTGFLMADGDLTIETGENVSQQRQIAKEYDIYFDPALQQYLQAYYAQLMAGGEEAEIAAEMIARAEAHEVLAEYIQKGATTTGTNVTIAAAAGDITNEGGAIAATQDVILTAGASIINNYLALTSQLTAADGCPDGTCGTKMEFHAGEVLAGHDLILTAGLNIENLASDIAAGNDVVLTAGMDIINSLVGSNHSVHDTETVEFVGPGLVRTQTCYFGSDDFCLPTYEVLDSSYTTQEYSFDEVNILAPGRIVSLYGDLDLRAGRAFVSLGSELSAGGDLRVVAEEEVMLHSYVDAEEDYIRRNERWAERICTTGKDSSCYWGEGFNWLTHEGTVLATATSNLVGRSIFIEAQDDVTLSGARLMAAGALNLHSVTGSVLIDSTDLPDEVRLTGEEGAEFVELEADVVAQIFGTPEVAQSYVGFLQDNELLTAVEALRRAESGADIKDAAQTVGVQSHVSLVSSDYLKHLRQQVEQDVAAALHAVQADIDTQTLGIAALNNTVQTELAALTARLDLSDADLLALVQDDIDARTVLWTDEQATIEADYQAQLAANEAEYGPLLSTQEQVWVSSGKSGYYKWVTVPNQYYVDLKAAADAQALSERDAALSSGQVSFDLDVALLQAGGTDAGIEAQIAALQAQFATDLEGLAAQKAALYASVETAIAEARVVADALRDQELVEDTLRAELMAAGSVGMGAGSLADALTEEAFPELALAQDLSLDASGIAQNARQGDVEHTRMVTQTRETGYFEDQVTLVTEPVTTTTGCGTKAGCTYTTTYEEVEVVEQVWIPTGTEEVEVQETYTVFEDTLQPLISVDQEEQDTFLKATAWRYGAHGGLTQLSSTPRSLVFADDDLSIDAAKDVYVIGATTIGAGNDLTVNAGRRIGLMGAINTNLRLGTDTRDGGYVERQTVVEQEPYYKEVCRNCGTKGEYTEYVVRYRDAEVEKDVFVADGSTETYDVAYEAFAEIGETLQLGTLMRDAYNAEITEGVEVIDGEEKFLKYAYATRNYALVTTAVTSGGDLLLSAGEDVLNFGGSAVAGENLYISAETDIRNEALRQNFTLSEEDGCVAHGCGREGHAYRAAELLSGSGMLLTAGGDIINNGSVIAAAGSIMAQAEGDIRNEALTSQYLYHYIDSSSFFGLKRNKQLLYRAIISEGAISTEYGDVTLDAGQDIVSVGSMISAGGLAQLNAGQDITLLAKSEELHNYVKQRGFSGLSYGQDVVSWNEFDTAFARVEGDDISLSAGRNVTGIGALLFAANDIDLWAVEDITFDAHQNLRYENRSGWSFGISFGGSGIIEALLNDEDILEAYVSTNSSLAAVHRLATGDFSMGSLLNLGYHLPSLGSAINKGAQGPGKTPMTSLVEQLNPFSWMDENALFNPDAFKGKPTAKDFLSGITFRLGVYKSSQEWTESHVSQVVAGQDLWLDAGHDISLMGGTVASANQYAGVFAGNDIVVAALADNYRSSSSGWGVSLGFGADGVTVGMDYNRSSATGETFTNAVLTAGETLDVWAGQDMALMGANLAAKDIYIDVGNDLIVQSRQNTSDSESFGFNFSVNINTGAFSGGVNGSEASRQYTDTPTTIVAEDRLSIYTGSTTYLLGAGIWSDTGNLELDTGDLLYDNYSDSDRSTSYGVNVSVGYTDGAFDPSNSDLSGTYAYRDVEALTFATVGPGTIRVRDYADYDFSEINRDPENMHRIVSETEFSIEIPGINLTKWTQEVRDTIDLIEAETTKIPDHVKNQGAVAVDAFKDMILGGQSPDDARKLAMSPAFRATVDARRKVISAIEHYGSLSNVPPEEFLLLAIAESAPYDQNGALTIPADCSLGARDSHCTVMVKDIKKEYKKLIEDVQKTGKLPLGIGKGALAMKFRAFVLYCIEHEPQVVLDLLNSKDFGEVVFAAFAEAGSYEQGNVDTGADGALGFDSEILISALRKWEIDRDDDTLLADMHTSRVQFVIDHGFERDMESAMILMGFVPVLGTALDASQVWVHAENGDYIAMAADGTIMLISMVPLVGPVSKVLKKGSKATDPKYIDDIAEEVGDLATARGLCSFHGDTLVLTDGGLLPIRDVNTNMSVWSRNPANGDMAWQQVQAQYSNPYDETVSVTMRDLETSAEQTIVSNRIHPYFVQTARDVANSSEGHVYAGPIKNGHWVDAADLVAGDRLLNDDGSWAEVVSVKIEAEPLTAFNLTVAEFHTYFVAANENAEPVWVHNDCFTSATTQRMNARVNIADDGSATVNFTERRATSLSTQDINALKVELREQGVQNVTINSGQIVEPTGRLERILQQKADTGGTWNGFSVWPTGNPNNPFILTGNL